jgi:hypothetical protein
MAISELRIPRREFVAAEGTYVGITALLDIV